MRKEKRPVSFRYSALLMTGAVMTVFLFACLLIMQVTMRGMLTGVEDRSFSERIRAVEGAVNAQVESLAGIAKEAAAWPESLEAAREPAGLYALSMRAQPLLSGAGVSFFLLQDVHGLPAFSLLSGGMEEGAEAASLSSFLSGLRASAAEGIAFYRSAPYAIAMEPIDIGGETVGTVCVGTLLDDAFFKDATQMEGVEVSLSLNPSGTAGATRVDYAADGRAIISTMLRDMNGRTVRLSAIVARTHYQAGQRSITWTLLLLIGLVLLFVLIIYLVITRKLARPMERLVQQIGALESGGTLHPDEYPNMQEYRELTGAINALVKSLNESNISLSVFEHILNGMNAYVYVSDPVTGEVVFLNDRMRGHFGIDASAVGAPCWALFDREQMDRCVHCPLPQLLEQDGGVIIWEEENRRTGRHYRNTDSLIDWIDGRKMHLQHRVEITDIKEAESALTRRLAQQELMSELSSEFIASRDTRHFIQHALEASGRFIGASRTIIVRFDQETKRSTLTHEWFNPQQSLGSIAPLFRPYQPGHPIYDAFIAGEAPYIAHSSMEGLKGMGVDAMRDDGVKSFLTLPLRIKNAIWGVMSISFMNHPHEWTQSDIHLFSMLSSLIAAVLDRQASEETIVRMSSIVESSPSFGAYITPEGRFAYINRGAQEVTGYSAEALMAGGMDILLDEDGRRSFYEEMLPTLLSTGRHSFELPVYRRDGERRLLVFSGFMIESGQGGIGILATDITEQRRMEEELVAAKEEAERSSRAKGDFLSRMSHEMRTPMNAIIGMTNIAQGTQDVARKDYCLGRIDEASTHLLGVINDILDMSKIEANKFELSPRPFELERMLRRIVDIIAVRTDEKRQTMLVDLDPSLPAWIIGDDQRLSQVITNLLSNATKFTPEAGVIRLDVREKEARDGWITLEISVTDSGIGISDEQLARLFKPFEQADGGIARKFGGTGLGLAISQRIVNMMGGAFEVTSVPEKGSTFRFTVQAQPAEAERRPILPLHPQLEAMRVLVVDDAPEVLSYFQALAERWGFACDVASSGEEATRLLERAQTPYDIAFIDWKMPGMDGLTLARRVKAIPEAPTAVIMISSADRSDIEPLAEAAGVDRFLAKPLFASRLLECVNEVRGEHMVDAGDVRERAESRPAMHLEGKRLLLAEDVEINREIVLALLEGSGIDVDIAENGREAVELVTQNPGTYDLIFMDIHMPEMDGYEATRRIRALPDDWAKRVPIVAMTANVFREDIERCRAVGMDDHIGKPIDIGAFYETLSRNLKEDEG